MTDEAHNATDMGRRTLLQTAGAAVVTGLVAGTATDAHAATQDADGMLSAERNEAPLGARFQGVQHFGLTVQNMERAYQFYTEVLGGTEVFRHGDFQGDEVQNTLLADQEIEANARGVNPRTIGVPDLRSGAQRLDVRFIQFDNMVLELLQYREADQPMGSAKSFADPVERMSPAFPRMMHICFYVRDDVDFNKFIAELEAESARRGMTQVRANRTIRVMTDADRKAAPRSANTEDRTKPGHFIFCEVFASQADFDAHNAMPYVKDWFAKLPELADDSVEVMRMAVLGKPKK